MPCQNRRSNSSKLRVTDARPGLVKFELPIEQHHTNRLKILHGGTLACLSTSSRPFLPLFITYSCVPAQRT